jgi:hypothetical protein
MRATRFPVDGHYKENNRIGNHSANAENLG